MPDIPFTQFLFPDGAPRAMLVDRSVDIATKADAVIKRGGRFEIEVLSNGVVSMTVEHRDHEIPVAIQLSPNGPPVLEAVDVLVMQAWERLVNLKGCD